MSIYLPLPMARAARLCKLFGVLGVLLGAANSVNSEDGRGDPLAKYESLSDGAPRQTLTLLAQARTLASQSAYPIAVDCSRDGQSVTMLDVAGRFRHWDLQTKAERTWGGRRPSPITAAAMAVEADRCAVALADGRLALDEVQSASNLATREFGQERVVALRFSPSGQYLLVVTRQGHIYVLNGKTGDEQFRWRAEPAAIYVAAWMPSETEFVCAPLDGSIHAYRLAEQVQPRVLVSGPSKVSGLAVSADGKRLAIARSDGVLHVQTLGDARPPLVLTGHTFAIWSVEFSVEDEHLLASASWDGTVRLWDSSTGTPVARLKEHSESVTGLQFVPQGKGLVSASLDGSLKFWPSDIPAVWPAARIAGRPAQVWVSLVSPDGARLLCGGNEGRLELWDLAARRMLWDAEGHETTRTADFSPDGAWVATGSSNGKVYLWDAANGREQRVFRGHPGMVSAVLFTDDGRKLISACDGRMVKIWDVERGIEAASLRGHREQIYCAELSPNGKHLFTAGGNWTADVPGELIVWDLQTRKQVRRWNAHRLAIWTIAFSPDGERFATSSSDATVKIWRTESFEPEQVLPHSTWVRPLVWSPDGKSLAVGRGDGVIRVWDTTTWTERTALRGHNQFTFFLNYHPDGKTVFAAGSDGTVLLWPQ